MSDHDDFGAFLIGFVVGGVAGAVAVLRGRLPGHEQGRREEEDDQGHTHPRVGESEAVPTGER